MKYVDGYVLPVPKKNIKKYQQIASKAGKIWREHGALEYMECAAEDMDAKGMVPFPKCANVKKGEIVVFAFVVFKSRAHRDKVNAKVMKDPRLSGLCGDGKAMPFDCTRMVYGGFNAIVDA